MEPQSGLGRQRLDPADVHIWTASLHQLAPQLSTFRGMLAAEELERAERFQFRCDINGFIAARGLLRAILAAYLGVDPAHLTFTYGPHGKPALSSSGSVGLSFNLSHSAEVAVVALARERPVGVDIERLKPYAEVADVPPAIFSDRQLSEFRSLPRIHQQSSFFKAWTRKEAFVKATGLGFSMSVREVEVTFAPRVAARLLRVNGNPDHAAQWTLRDLPAPAGFKAAVAVPGTVRHILRQEWNGACTGGGGLGRNR